MAVYDKNGNVLAQVFDKNGVVLIRAYDKDGNAIYQQNPITLKVMQYNCGQWYIGSHDNVPSDKDSEYYSLQSGIISDNDADVILFEEYTAQFSKAGRTAVSLLSDNYPYYHEETNGTTTTVTQRAIFSKYPISNYVTHPFNDGTTYYFDSCTITVNGIPIHVIVTHLHWNDITKRAQEASLIRADANNYDYVIIGGDMNTVDNYGLDGEDYIAVLKPFVDDGYKLANGGTYGFLKTATTGSVEAETCLDNIIISENISFTSVTVDRTKETDDVTDVIDHEPIVAELFIS